MANHITQLRKKSGFRYVSEAAQEIGISKSMLYQTESSYKRPSSILGIKMSQACQCSLDEIFLPFKTTISDKK
jgi:putative transcriptional regulator